MADKPKNVPLSKDTKKALTGKGITPEQIQELEEHLNRTRILMEKMTLDAAGLGTSSNDPKMNVTLQKKP